MNAYHSELMFKDSDDKLHYAGVCLRQEDSITIEPVGSRYVTGVVLSACDIIGLLSLALPVFTSEEIAQIAEILGLDQ